MGQHDTVWDALDTLLDNGLSATVGQDDDTLLDRGTSVVVITRQPSWTRLNGAFGVARRMLSFPVEVYATTRADVTSETDTVIALLEDYPSLNGQTGVSGLRVEAAGTPSPVTDTRGGGPHYWMKELTVEIEFQYAKSGGEYA